MALQCNVLCCQGELHIPLHRCHASCRSLLLDCPVGKAPLSSAKLFVICPYIMLLCSQIWLYTFQWPATEAALLLHRDYMATVDAVAVSKSMVVVLAGNRLTVHPVHLSEAGALGDEDKYLPPETTE